MEGGLLSASLLECTEVLDGFLAVGATLEAPWNKTGVPVSGEVAVVEDFDSPFDCADGTETTGPLTLTPLDEETDTDEDACPDYDELGDDPLLGGLRDPFNPYDIFSVNGDSRVDLPNDILGVILRWTPNPSQPYDAAYDRGLTIGPNHWNRDAPDGVIDLPNDILGVILQWTHEC